MYPNPTASHSGIQIHQIVQELQKNGYEFRVIFTVPCPPFPFNLINKWNHFSRAFPQHYEIDDVQIDFLRYYTSHKLIPLRNLGTTLLFTLGRKLRNIIGAFKPDLIWTQPALPNGWAAMKFHHKFKLPYIITVHGADINESIKLSGAAQKMRIIYENASSVITISQRLDREVKKIAPIARRRLVYFGIDPDSIKEAAELRLQHLLKSNPDRPLRILSVSNLIETKGLQYNIQAMNSLLKKHHNIEYNVIGEGNYGSELKRLTTNLGLDQYIHFRGRLSHSEVMKEMAIADIFSLPSYAEGLGMVYLESMALRVPAVGVEGQGIEDVIVNGENGFLVKSQNAADLTMVLDKLLNEAERRSTIGERARQHIAQNFTWDATIRQYDEIFKAAISDRANQT